MFKFSLRGQFVSLCHEEMGLRRKLHAKAFETARFFCLDELVLSVDDIPEYRVLSRKAAYSAGQFLLQRMENILAEMDELAAEKCELQRRFYRTLRWRVYIGLLKLGVIRPIQPLIGMKHEGEEDIQ